MQREKPPEWREKQKGSRGIRRGQRYRLVFQFPIRELGAERIGHGVKAIEDRALMDFLAEQQIGIESCLTSNIQTSTVAELAAHPLKTFLEHGIRASINTDDPGVQGVDIIHEYTVAAPAAGLSREQIRQAQINGLEMAFLSAEEKRALREKVAAK
ncbi:adenosine deaminase [Escherichia coli]|nr:adenosine deaminase [Escherichia coli]